MKEQGNAASLKLSLKRLLNEMVLRTEWFMHLADFMFHMNSFSFFSFVEGAPFSGISKTHYAEGKLKMLFETFPCACFACEHPKAQMSIVEDLPGRWCCFEARNSSIQSLDVCLSQLFQSISDS